MKKAGTSAETEPVPPVPVGSPRKRKQEDDHKETSGKKPKAVEHKDTAGKTPKAVERKDTGAKKPKTTKGPQHVDDEDFELDLDTGKFVQKKKKPKTPVESTKDDDHHDESTSQKWKATDESSKPIDTVDESQSRDKKRKKTAAVPLLEDDDDQDDDDLMIVDNEDCDKNYAPGDDEQDDDDDDYPVLDDDDDDFQEPPPRARKTTKKEKKQTKKQATQRRVEQSKKDDDDAINEETLSLFQRIVGDNFEVRTSQEYEDESVEKRDRCINPIEAAGFRATMKTLVLEVKKAVRKGKQIKETYIDMIESTIKVAKVMKYPGAMTVQTEDILPSIKDINCHAWRKHLQGKTTMEPGDLVMDDEEEHEADEDLLIQQNMLGKEATDAAAAAIENIPKMIVNDINKKLRNLFDHIEKAHKHAGEVTRTLRELHKDLPLDVF